ncbi:major royal jelly protein 1-like [Phymastichus coffea]|uniref:major royal jelly protein 1-like n=1 Tax=Phymastichus coffea TaxID=108790 RepID=UPI00273AD8AB|nr:major royal jelly protein 1-like [Phymastichus coffea]
MNYYYFLFLIILLTKVTDSELVTVYKWKQVNYTRDSLKIFEHYNMSKAVPYDFEKAEDGRIFLTVIATPYVPMSLTTITNQYEDYGPLLAPYPNSTWFLDSNNCNNITNARSITIDSCNRLWVLDTGRIDHTQICNAKLLVFDLRTDRLIEKHEIPKDISQDQNGMGVLVTPIVHVDEQTCKLKTVYMADSEGYALIMFNGTNFVRLTGPEFEPVDNETHFNISGETFTLHGGIVPMDLDHNSNYLVFAPLASRNLFAFNATLLAEVFHGREKPEVEAAYEVLRKQPTAFRWTIDGKALLVAQADNTISCWNHSKSPDVGNISSIIIDNRRLQYVSSLKIYPESITNGEEELWALSIRLQKVINGSRKLDEINFRMMKASIRNLQRDSNCCVDKF